MKIDENVEVGLKITETVRKAYNSGGTIIRVDI
jgi:hypothetical protein